MVSAREMFHSTNLIRRATDMFDWDRAFINTIVDEKMFTFNKTILNTLSNFVLQETLTVDDQKKIKKSHPREKQCLQELSKILKTMITYNASGDRNFYKKTYITKFKHPN